MISVTETTTEDLSVVEHLRIADLREVKALTGEEPLSALARSVQSSALCFTAFSGTTPIAIFGVGPDPQSEAGGGIVWLVGTDEIAELGIAFLRRSDKWLRMMAQPYTYLWNIVDARNTLHIRWLRWLGFHAISEYENYGVEGRKFIEFMRMT